MVALGGYLTLDVVWKIADIVNGLMALPNLIALLVLSPIIIKETNHTLNAINKEKSSGSFFLALSAPILATTALLRYMN